MMKYLIRIAFLIAFVMPFYAQAGWLINGRIIDREGNTILKRYFIQDNVVKVEMFNLIYICNLKTESIILVDPENLIYVQTTFNAFQTKMREFKSERLRALLELVPEDKKSEYEAIYRQQIEQQVILPEYGSDSLDISILSDNEKLLGHKATKYKISENGRKKEEFIFTSEIDIRDHLDMNAFLKYIYLIEPQDNTIKYMASDKYRETVKNGLVLRRFIYEDGYRSEWQVNETVNKTIPSYEFGIPDLCKEVTLDKWINRKNDSEGQYYDDYE
jgi:hypothetical protein